MRFQLKFTDQKRVAGPCWISSTHNPRRPPVIEKVFDLENHEGYHLRRSLHSPTSHNTQGPKTREQYKPIFLVIVLHFQYST